MVYGRETCPDTQRKHLQGFVYFNAPRSMAAVRKEFAPRHLDLTDSKKGGNLGAIAYCKKDGDFVERGIPPTRGDNKCAATDYAEIVNLAKQGNLSEIADKYPKQFLTQFRNLEQVKRFFQQPASHLNKADNWWLYGPTGTGKSHTARLLLYPGKARFVKDADKWFDHYDGEPVLVLEEVCPNKEVGGEGQYILASTLKKWADKWNFPAQVKGGVLKPIRPEVIIVTSNYSIEECYPDPKDYEAIRRRFPNVRYMDVPYAPPVPDQNPADLDPDDPLYCPHSQQSDHE